MSLISIFLGGKFFDVDDKRESFVMGVVVKDTFLMKIMEILIDFFYLILRIFKLN